MNLYNFEKIKYPYLKFRSRKKANAIINKFIAETRLKAKNGLHLGAGASKIENLINCDLFNPEADQKVDAINLLTFNNESVDWIETHHMIEHLSIEETKKAFREWNRVLTKNGLLIITCPDILKICKRWILFSIIYPIYPRPQKIDYMVKMLVGSQNHKGMFHRNAFDIRRISRILEENGFKVELHYSPYPRRTTPSLLVIARKINSL